MAQRKSEDQNEERKAAFIELLAATGNVSESSRRSGLERRTAYNWRKADEEFRKAWDEAEQLGVDSLIDEGHRRAKRGVKKPVFWKGEIVGYHREYSDTLLMFLVKRHRPEYRDSSKLEHGGTINQQHSGHVEHTLTLAEQIAKYEESIDEAARLEAKEGHTSQDGPGEPLDP